MLNRLQALMDEIPKEKLGILQDEGAPDEQEWDRYLRPLSRLLLA